MTNQDQVSQWILNNIDHLRRRNEFFFFEPIRRSEIEQKYNSRDLPENFNIKNWSGIVVNSNDENQREFLFFCHMKPDVYISSNIIAKKRWEKLNLNAMEYYLNKRGGIFIDIGANIGWHTVNIASLVGCDVYCFEPEKGNYEILEANINFNSFTNIKSFNLALGFNTSKSKIFLSEDNQGDHKVNEGNDWQESQLIDLVRLDDIMGGQKGNIGLIKIDVQGSEYDVVRGAQHVIIKNKPVILMEVWPSENGQKAYDNILSLGYLAYKISAISQEFLGDELSREYKITESFDVIFIPI